MKTNGKLSLVAISILLAGAALTTAQTQDLQLTPPQPLGDPGPGVRGPGPGVFDHQLDWAQFQMLMTPFLLEQLELSAEQRREIQALQKETHKKLLAILTVEQRQRLQELTPRDPRDNARGPRFPRDSDG